MSNLSQGFSLVTSGTVQANNNAAVTTNNLLFAPTTDLILLSLRSTVGADAGQANVTAVAVGEFTIKSGVADTSTYNYFIFRKN